MIKLAASDSDIEKCFAVLSELRPHLDRNTLVPHVRELMGEGYQLAYRETATGVVCVAGFRIFHNLFAGKNLYVDDLVTLESERSKGHGKAMIIWLQKLALDSGCKVFNLDSGVQRFGAHKFYFNQGMKIVSYHFYQEL